MTGQAALAGWSRKRILLTCAVWVVAVALGGSAIVAKSGREQRLVEIADRSKRTQLANMPVRHTEFVVLWNRNAALAGSVLLTGFPPALLVLAWRRARAGLK